MKEAIHLSDLCFDDVLSSNIWVLVDFYAAELLDCQKQGVVIEDLAQRYQGRVVMAKLDVDKNPGITSRYRVTKTPTLILFKEGKEVARFLGYVPERELKLFLDKKISNESDNPFQKEQDESNF